MNNEIERTLRRKGAIVEAAPERHIGLRAIADDLSRRNADGATCELLNEALSRMVLLGYEQDAGGFCNIDPVTGRILIPVPWGSNGYVRWGLRPQEANILRAVLKEWQHESPSLLNYDTSRRAWHVNLYDFANFHLAKQWLKAHQIGVGLYRAMRAKTVG